MTHFISKIGYVACFILFLAACKSENKNNTTTSSYTNATFKVWGECEMCKETIETALKDVKGIEKANWDVESKMITLSYDSSVIKLAEVGKIIAEAGYDNEMEKSDDENYAKLPDCCQYERK